MKVLGIIPARGGSKGIPGKNIRMLRGKPVLQYTAEAAHAASSLSRLIVTTDSEEIAAVARRLDLEVPFMRPAELARDDTPMVPVLQHAVAWLESSGDSFDAICVLQPTSPLRRPELIDGCCRLMMSSQADSVFTVARVPHRYNPYWVYVQREGQWLEPALGGKEIGCRQQLPTCYQREGSVYLVSRDVLMEQNTLFGPKLCGLPVEPGSSVNLDHPDDFARAERMLESAEHTGRSSLEWE